jgi:hypothetical protein
MSTAFTLVDVLAEVSDSPTLFNALSPLVREFLLHWRPDDRLAKPGIEATLTEISDKPALFNALSPEAREFMLRWVPASNP